MLPCHSPNIKLSEEGFLLRISTDFRWISMQLRLISIAFLQFHGFRMETDNDLELIAHFTNCVFDGIAELATKIHNVSRQNMITQ